MRKLLLGVDGVPRGCFWRVLGGVYGLIQFEKIKREGRMGC